MRVYWRKGQRGRDSRPARAATPHAYAACASNFREQSTCALSSISGATYFTRCNGLSILSLNVLLIFPSVAGCVRRAAGCGSCIAEQFSYFNLVFRPPPFNVSTVHIIMIFGIPFIFPGWCALLAVLVLFGVICSLRIELHTAVDYYRRPNYSGNHHVLMLLTIFESTLPSSPGASLS